MKFDKVTVITSCVPGFKLEPGELAIWFDGSRRDDPVYVAHSDPLDEGVVNGWRLLEKGTSIAECLRLHE